MEEIESLHIAFTTLALEHQEMKQRIIVLERALKMHVNDLNAHEL
jgi:hypothetical protein